MWAELLQGRWGSWPGKCTDSQGQEDTWELHAGLPTQRQPRLTPQHLPTGQLLTFLTPFLRSWTILLGSPFSYTWSHAGDTHPFQQLDNTGKVLTFLLGPFTLVVWEGGELRANQASEAARGTDRALGQTGKCVDKGYQDPEFPSSCLTHRRMEDLLHLEVGEEAVDLRAMPT